MYTAFGTYDPIVEKYVAPPTTPHPIATLTSGTNSVAIYDDIPSMTRKIQRVEKSGNTSIMTSYGFLDTSNGGTSMYIPSLGRLDISHAKSNNNMLIIPSMTLYFDALAAPHFTTKSIKFVPS